MNWNSDQKALMQWITSRFTIKEVRELKGDSGYLLNNMIAKVTLARYEAAGIKVSREKLLLEGSICR